MLPPSGVACLGVLAREVVGGSAADLGRSVRGPCSARHRGNSDRPASPRRSTSRSRRLRHLRRAASRRGTPGMRTMSPDAWLSGFAPVGRFSIPSSPSLRAALGGSASGCGACLRRIGRR